MSKGERSTRSKGTSFNWKLVLSYDGGDFAGWQVQPGQRTVQGELGDAIERITGERVLPQGSGRTDAGVHAQAQVASVLLAAPIPGENLHRALNRTLPEAIRILSVESVPLGFHARHSATAKTYEYRIYRGKLCPPWLARYCYALPSALDVTAMQAAAGLVVGEHDFTSFAAGDPDRTARSTGLRVGYRGMEDMGIEDTGTEQDPARDPPAHAAAGNVRTIAQSEWRVEDGGELLIYRVKGDGFLHHMVRNLVGTFLDVGRGRTTADSLPAILAARSRSSAGATAPARGLFLVCVDYGEKRSHALV